MSHGHISSKPSSHGRLRSCFFGVAEVCSWDLVLEKYSDLRLIFQMVKDDMAASDFPETIDIGLSTMNCYSKHHSLRGVGLEMIGIYSYFSSFLSCLPLTMLGWQISQVKSDKSFGARASPRRKGWVKLW